MVLPAAINVYNAEDSNQEVKTDTTVDCQTY
uniref:Uncharacterized protein n=1 Tax=Arundo donax TaxID=35708 RepID=A0A0A9A1M5_ARUDO